MSHERCRNRERRKTAIVRSWLCNPLSDEVKKAIERLARAPDVQRIAVMPDVHLAEGVCIGSVVATSHLLYPQAVGGDIGCGMAAIGFDAGAGRLRDPSTAQRVLELLARVVPAMRHPSRESAPALPTAETDAAFSGLALSSPALISSAEREGRVEFGTLGRGNHFVEFQTGADDRLWLMVHTGSRHMGQAITALHLRRAMRAPGGLWFLDADTQAGQAYLNDLAWARTYANANRRQIISAVAETLVERFSMQPAWNTLISCDHNHVRSEEHFGRRFWVHRKGATPAGDCEAGIIPGSMGTRSFHVLGRGCEESLRSSSHGAGRVYSREQARRNGSPRTLAAEMAGVCYDVRLASWLVDEAPSAYKDVGAVMRAQRELTRIVRELRPILVYKGV